MLGNVGECPSSAPNKKLMKVLKGKEVKEGTGCQRWGSQAAPLPSDCYGCGGAHPLRGGYLWYRRRPACLKGGSGRWVPHLYITFPVCQNSLVAVFAFIAAVICIVFLRYLYIYFFLDFFWKWEVGSGKWEVPTDSKLLVTVEIYSAIYVGSELNFVTADAFYKLYMRSDWRT